MEIPKIIQKGDTWRIKGVPYRRFPTREAAENFLKKDDEWKSVEETSSPQTLMILEDS